MNRKRAAQSLVELALCLPVLMMILCAVIEFGFLFYQTGRIYDACREGARLGVQGSTVDQIQDRVQAVVPDMQIPDLAIFVHVYNNSGVEQDPNDRTQGNRLEVQVTFAIKSLTPFGIVFGRNASNSRTILARSVYPL